MISRKLSKKPSKRLSRKTKYSSRKRLSKRLSKKVTKKTSKKTIKKKILKGGGKYKIKTEGGSCFAFNNIDHMIALIEHIKETFFSGPIGPEPADASILQKQMNRQRQGIHDLKIALGYMKSNNKTTYDISSKAGEAIQFIEKHISDNINFKRIKANLPQVTKNSKDYLLSAVPFKYDKMEDHWVNAITRPCESIC